MNRKSFLLLAPAVMLAVAFSFPSSPPSPPSPPIPRPLGAPWISVEIPANPLDPAARGAAMLVHTYLHEHPAGFPARGTAEGLIDGVRRSIELEISPTSRPGVYAVAKQWPSEGHWVLAIELNANRGGPGIMVELGANGGAIADDRSEYGPRAITLGQVRTLLGGVPESQIETALSTMAQRAERYALNR